MPTNYAIVASAIGAGLADLSTGAAIWVIPTIIIKPILVLFFTSKSDKIINKRNIVASVVAGIVGLVLYMFAEGIIIGSFTSAFVMSLLGLLQPIGSFIVFIILGMALDKLDFKNVILIKNLNLWRKIMNILYTIENSIYVNITNTCPCSCVFV